MVMWQNVNYKTESQSILLGDGENTYLSPFDIKNSESIYSRNTSNKLYPSLACRYGMSRQFGTYSTPLTAINGAGVRNGTDLHVLDNTVWKRYNTGTSAWVNVLSGMVASQAKFLDFTQDAPTRLTIFTDGTNVRSWNGTVLTDLVAAGAPATKLYTVDDYRLYAATTNAAVLYCSAVGSVTDWATVEDADTIPISGMIGVPSAIATYNDTVIIWSEYTMHILYGDDPSNFQFNKNPIESGCISDRSVIIHNGILYYMDYYKFIAFDGGMPIEISQKVKKYLDNINYSYKQNIVCGKWNKYLYISIPYGDTTTNNLTLEFDTELKTWFVINRGFKSFVNINNYLYGADNAGAIWRMNDNKFGLDDYGNASPTLVPWEHHTPVMIKDPINKKKVLSEIWLYIHQPVVALDIYYSIAYDATYNSVTWELLNTVDIDTNLNNVQAYRLQIPIEKLQNIDYFLLKFASQGSGSIKSMEFKYRIKAR